MSDTWQDTWSWGLGPAPITVQFKESRDVSTWESIPTLKKSLLITKEGDQWVLDKNKYDCGPQQPNYWVEFNDGTAVKKFRNKNEVMDFILSWIIPRQDIVPTFNKEGKPGWWS